MGTFDPDPERMDGPGPSAFLGGVAQGNRLAPLTMGVGMALSFAGIGVLIGALGPVLGLFGLGAALPLVVVAYASRRGFQAVRDKVLAHGDKVKKVFGGLIFLAGLAIASGGDKWLEAQIVPLLPEAWLRATTLF